jgi:hypothetical protein
VLSAPLLSFSAGLAGRRGEGVGHWAPLFIVVVALAVVVGVGFVVRPFVAICEMSSDLSLPVLPLGAGSLSSRFSVELSRWEVAGEAAEAEIPLNKSEFGQLLGLHIGAVNLLPTGHGGEGKKRTSALLCGSGGWRLKTRMLRLAGATPRRQSCP